MPGFPLNEIATEKRPSGWFGLWPGQVKTAAKPKPGPRTSRGGLRLRLRLRERVRSSAGRAPAPGGFWPVQVRAFTVEQDQDLPAGLREVDRLREDRRAGVQVQGRRAGARCRARPGALAGPGASLHRGAGSGSTGRAPAPAPRGCPGPGPSGFVLGLWPVQGEAFAVER